MNKDIQFEPESFMEQFIWSAFRWSMLATCALGIVVAFYKLFTHSYS